MSVSPFSDLAAIERALKRRQVSSVELTRMCLGRLDTLGREHRAVVELLEEPALKAARESDGRRAKGRSLGPLDGIPYGIKDMFATKTGRTTWGSPAHANQRLGFDATAVKRLNRAGAVLVAKLAMIELAGGGNYNMAGASATGACLCAHDKKRWAGGSSSGPGAAVGLGCVPFALGSETWGSITCPSAFNGATGLRPTYGRVSRYGAMALAWTHDKIGCLARTAVDAGKVVSVIAGRDPNDPTTLDEPMPVGPARGAVRVGLLNENFKGNFATRAEAAYRDAIKALEELGCKLVEIKFPDLPYATAMELIIIAEGASAFENLIRSERIHMLPDKDQVAGFLAGLEIKAIDYLWALRVRTQALRANEVWNQCDCVFTPTFMHAAPPAEGKFSDTWKHMEGEGGPPNLLGWPAMAFPFGMDDWVVPPAEPGTQAPQPQPPKPGEAKQPPKDPGVSGTALRKLGYSPAPIGAQVYAPAGREDVCLRVAADLQRATRHHLVRPKGA